MTNTSSYIWIWAYMLNVVMEYFIFVFAVLILKYTFQMVLQWYDCNDFATPGELSLSLSLLFYSLTSFYIEKSIIRLHK